MLNSPRPELLFDLIFCPVIFPTDRRGLATAIPSIHTCDHGRELRPSRCPKNGGCHAPSICYLGILACNSTHQRMLLVRAVRRRLWLWLRLPSVLASLYVWGRLLRYGLVRSFLWHRRLCSARMLFVRLRWCERRSRRAAGSGHEYGAAAANSTAASHRAEPIQFDHPDAHHSLTSVRRASQICSAELTAA